MVVVNRQSLRSIAPRRRAHPGSHQFNKRLAGEAESPHYIRMSAAYPPLTKLHIKPTATPRDRTVGPLPDWSQLFPTKILVIVSGTQPRIEFLPSATFECTVGNCLHSVVIGQLPVAPGFLRPSGSQVMKVSVVLFAETLGLYGLGAFGLEAGHSSAIFVIPPPSLREYKVSVSSSPLLIVVVTEVTGLDPLSTVGSRACFFYLRLAHSLMVS